MNLNSLNNKKIGILGLGLENQALVKYLLKEKVKCEITVCDARPEIKNDLPVSWQLGSNFNRGLEKFDILFRSPGWSIACPGIQRAVKIQNRKSKIENFLSSPMKLFFDLCPTKNTIGVTGTKGKGTTASLIYEILKTAGKMAQRRRGASVHLGGNIGVAPFEFIDKIRANDWVVLELSSFQLQDMTKSPKIAVITNFYSEHLASADPNNPNYHKSLEEYRRAKLNIVKWQKGGDKMVLNPKSQIPRLDSHARRARRANPEQISNFKYEISKQIKGKVVYFRKFELPSKLMGEHNKENIGAAVAVAKIVGVKNDKIKKAVAGFKGLPHRLELVRTYQGVKYYNDSFATTPESTMIALKSFAESVVLLLGGADKGANFKKLAKEIKKRVKQVVLLAGDSTPRIGKELLTAGLKPEKIELAHDIKTAVKIAARQAVRGEIILLSPACASFGMFRNYKERGDLFKAEVRKLR